MNIVQSLLHFWCLFLDPHPTTSNSNIGVQSTFVLELGVSTLMSLSMWMSQSVCR